MLFSNDSARITLMPEVQFLKSELLEKNGVKHGWFMRFGGVSEGLFESLNGKKGNGDTDSNVDENRERALSALDQKSNSLAHIVHEFKDNIELLREPCEYLGADASITDTAAVTLSQTTADCASLV